MAPRKIRVGLNGFGPLGRQVFKAIHENYPTEMEVAAINDDQPLPLAAHLLRYDSTYGHFLASVTVAEQQLVVNDEAIPCFVEAVPPWGALGVDVVIETSPRAAEARAHLAAGARKVIVSGRTGDADLTLCLGANEGAYDPTRHHLLGAVECAANAVAPLLALLQAQLGARRVLLTTLDAFRHGQPLLDGVHQDPRLSRSAPQNLIPTAGESAEGLATLFPALSSSLSALSVGVPVPGVSMVHLVATLERPTSREALNALLKAASEGDDWLGEVLGYSDEPLVSSDYLGNPTSATVDGPSTEVVGGTLARLVAWYDGEWGYANRLADMVYFIAAEVETFEA